MYSKRETYYANFFDFKISIFAAQQGADIPSTILSMKRQRGWRAKNLIKKPKNKVYQMNKWLTWKISMPNIWEEPPQIMEK